MRLFDALRTATARRQTASRWIIASRMCRAIDHERRVILPLMKDMGDNNSLAVFVVKRNVVSDQNGAIAKSRELRHARQSERHSP